MMSSQPSNPDVSRQRGDSRDSRSIEEKEIDSIANDAAEAAEKEEQSYDEEHDIFTK